MKKATLIPRGRIVYNSIDITFLDDKAIEIETKLVVVLRVLWGGRQVVVLEEKIEGSMQ